MQIYWEDVLVYFAFLKFGIVTPNFGSAKNIKYYKYNYGCFLYNVFSIPHIPCK